MINVNVEKKQEKIKMHKEDKAILEEICLTRNLSKNTARNYKQSIKGYTESQGLTLKKLLEEAEAEEEKAIRLKNRTLKKRIITFQNYLLNEKGLSKNTIRKQVTAIKTIYRHYEIEIPNIPKFNEKHMKDYEPIYYDDLPSKELIQQALKLCKPNMRAVTLFIVSSGCSREETLGLSIQDFITATEEYHNSTNIHDVLEELKHQDNIVPIFKLKRKKTSKHYYTFCSPEAVDAIIYYLESRTDLLTPEKKLFKFNKSYFQKKFIEINEMLGGHKKGAYGIFRSHMLRKFHASNLARGENGLTVEEIDSLQGRSKNKVHNSYFLDDPQELRKKYIANIDKVLINYDSKEISFESPEVHELRMEAERLKEENKRIKNEIDDAVSKRINEVFSEYGIDDILKKHGL